jgi:hypothetical protein
VKLDVASIAAMTVGQNSPYPDDLLVEQARDLYFAANGFSLRDYDAPTFTLGILGLSFKFPNTAGRKRIVPFHDLHHVLTGFATDWAGEAEIGAWELRAGCDNFAAYFLNAGGVVIGLFLCPRRLWRAFRAAKGQRTLYRDPLPYDRLLQMTVGELRKRLGMRPGGLATRAGRGTWPARTD